MFQQVNGLPAGPHLRSIGVKFQQVYLGPSSGSALPCVESGSRVSCWTDLGLSQACTVFSKCVKEMCTRFTFQFDSQSFTLLPWICVICAECRGQVAYCVISQNQGPTFWLSISLDIPYSFFPERLPHHIPLTDKRDRFLWNSLLPLLLLREVGGRKKNRRGEV